MRGPLAWLALVWLTVIVAFILAASWVMPSPAEVCSYAGGEWDQDLMHCFLLPRP